MKCSICGREMLRILNISFECLNMDCKNFEVKFFLEFTDVADVDSNIEHFNPERKYCGLE